MASKGHVHVVDDDKDFRDSLQGLLEAAGFDVTAYESALHFLEAYKPGNALCLVADIRMPAMDGLELQKELVQRGDTVPMIIMTGHGDVPLAVKAMRAGAVDFLEKPFDLPLLLDSIERARVSQAGDGAAAADAEKRLAELT